MNPGVTGWAQLRYAYGANEEDAMEKLQYDLYYVKNQSLMLDLMIILQTVEVVLWGKRGGGRLTRGTDTRSRDHHVAALLVMTGYCAPR
ncbi:MAG: sugar transferase [Woeseiaceae bacterium]|nr:sugar transferase [Woeseiaceae bacterium]